MSGKKIAKVEVSLFDELSSCIEDSYSCIMEHENDYVGYYSCCHGRRNHEKDCPSQKALKIVEELKEKYERKDY